VTSERVPTLPKLLRCFLFHFTRTARLTKQIREIAVVNVTGINDQIRGAEILPVTYTLYLLVHKLLAPYKPVDTDKANSAFHPSGVGK